MSCQPGAHRCCVVPQAREFEEERAKAAAAQEAASAQAQDLQAEVERVEEHQVLLKGAKW